ncbi:MAG: hypothetical protein R3F39_14615 [Myxococcota bacterium]
MLNLLRRLVMVGALALVVPVAVSSCGKPTLEGRVNSYQRAKDRLEVLGSKMPALKMDIQAKVAEFDAAFQAANAKGGEEAVREIGALLARMDAYEKQMDPTKGAAAQPVGSKLAPAAGQPGALPAPGTKLTPPSRNAMPQPPAGGSGFGEGGGVRPSPVQGGALPTGMPTRAPAQPGQLQQVPRPAPAPPVAPAAPAQPGGSGFGGQ